MPAPEREESTTLPEADLFSPPQPPRRAQPSISRRHSNSLAQNLPFPGHLNCLGWHPARKEYREHAAILILAQNLEHHVLPLVEVRHGAMQSVERIYSVVVDLDNH